MKRMKQNSKKAKYIGIGLASLGAVSVFSIGFAAWVIGATDVQQTGNITVETADVQTEELTLKLAETGNDTSISFGPDGTTASGGLIYSTGGDEEDLEAKLVMTLTSANRTIARNLNFTVDYGDTIEKFVTDKYITVPFTADTATPIATLAQSGGLTAAEAYSSAVEITRTTPAEGTEVNDTTTQVVYTITVTLNFGWGSAFNGKNPIAMTGDATTDGTTTAWTRETLKTALEAMANATAESATQSITVKITSTSAS